MKVITVLFAAAMSFATAVNAVPGGSPKPTTTTTVKTTTTTRTTSTYSPSSSPTNSCVNPALKQCGTGQYTCDGCIPAQNQTFCRPNCYPWRNPKNTCFGECAHNRPWYVCAILKKNYKCISISIYIYIYSFIFYFYFIL